MSFVKKHWFAILTTLLIVINLALYILARTMDAFGSCPPCNKGLCPLIVCNIDYYKAWFDVSLILSLPAFILMTIIKIVSIIRNGRKKTNNDKV